MADSSSAASALKPCAGCLRSQPTSLFSGAQLKRKGKRLCKVCTGEVAPSEVPDDSAESQLASLLSAHQQTVAHLSSSHGAPAAARAPASAEAPSLSVASVRPISPVDAAPPNTHFPSQLPALYDAVRGVAVYAYSSEERQLALMQKIIEADLSEPYSVFTYRYFLNIWPQLSFLAMKGNECIGCIVCRVTLDKRGTARGYIAMLAVSPGQRGAGLGTLLVRLALQGMVRMNAGLCVLEAEATNKGALALYEKLNFVRECRLVKYYLSGSDAFRLKLWLQPPGYTHPDAAALPQSSPGQHMHTYGDDADD